MVQLKYFQCNVNTLNKKTSGIEIEMNILKKFMIDLLKGREKRTPRGSDRITHVCLDYDFLKI